MSHETPPLLRADQGSPLPVDPSCDGAIKVTGLVNTAAANTRGFYAPAGGANVANPAALGGVDLLAAPGEGVSSLVSPAPPNTSITSSTPAALGTWGGYTGRWRRCFAAAVAAAALASCGGGGDDDSAEFVIGLRTFEEIETFVEIQQRLDAAGIHVRSYMCGFADLAKLFKDPPVSFIEGHTPLKVLFRTSAADAARAAQLGIPTFRYWTEAERDVDSDLFDCSRWPEIKALQGG